MMHHYCQLLKLLSITFRITFSHQPILSYFSAFKSLAALPEHVVILILQVVATRHNKILYNAVQRDIRTEGRERREAK